MSENKFYITTTLPYVNAEPHIGFALEIIEADVIARYHRHILAEEVLFNTGVDEHGQKIFQKAQEQKINPQEYCDHYATKFHHLKELLNLSYDHFIRTTDEKHIKAAQAFWQKCMDNGDIYKDQYEVKYCVGCELAKTESELIDGRCPLHPNTDLELRNEENYFFRFSKYAEKLLTLYEENPEYVKPTVRFNEIKSFVAKGLEDFSISRLKEKMSWGIPVPNDDRHVMYVWFDALVNYISTLDWPNEDGLFQDFWPAVQVAGKDNLRQQSAMWQAMLMSAGIKNSKRILINGFIGVDGKKMSKSLGNVISPQELVDKYGIDASRFLLVNLGTFSEDMDVSWEKLDNSYNAELANGIGNLCSRVAKMAASVELNIDHQTALISGFDLEMENYNLKAALDLIKNEVAKTDKFLAEKQPWKKEGQEKIEILETAIQSILDIAYSLQIFMPETAEKILKKFQAEKITALEEALFPRL